MTISFSCNAHFPGDAAVGELLPQLLDWVAAQPQQDKSDEASPRLQFQFVDGLGQQWDEARFFALAAANQTHRKSLVTLVRAVMKAIEDGRLPSDMEQAVLSEPAMQLALQDALFLELLGDYLETLEYDDCMYYDGDYHDYELGFDRVYFHYEHPKLWGSPTFRRWRELAEEFPEPWRQWWQGMPSWSRTRTRPPLTTAGWSTSTAAQASTRKPSIGPNTSRGMRCKLTSVVI